MRDQKGIINIFYRTLLFCFFVQIISGQSFLQVGLDIDGNEAHNRIGGYLSLSADGNRLAVKVGNNQVRIYEWSGDFNSWQQVGTDIDGEAGGDGNGSSISLSADGSRVAIGAPYNDGGGESSGHVRIYELLSGTWQQVGADIDGVSSDLRSGYSVSLSADGSRVAIGAPFYDYSIPNGSNTFYKYDAGQVRIFEFFDGNWLQVGTDIDGGSGGDESGSSVSLSADGSRVAIGSPESYRAGHVSIYDWSGSNWQKVGNDISGDFDAGDRETGSSVSLSADGTRVAIGDPRSAGVGINQSFEGHVKIYEWSAEVNSWQQVGTDIDGEARGDASGSSVSLSADGSRVAIGAPFNDGGGENSGHARIYDWSGFAWQQVGTDIDGEAGGDGNGSSISLSADGSRVAIGAPDNDGGGEYSGHVRIYDSSDPELPTLDLDDFYESPTGLSAYISAIPTSGYPIIYSYQWYFNGFAIPANFGGTNPSYTINGILSNEGTWRVVVTNDTGSTEASFEYRVFSDADSDGLSDYRESNITNTNPSLADTDSDGLNDFVELNTTLTDPNDSDSDDDTLLDGAEVNTYGSDPNDTDSDDDGLLDDAEVNTYNTSPIDADSDNDTLTDSQEVLTYFTNPNLADSDSDGLSDAAELNTYFSLPNTSDTDGDGLTDGDEVNIYSSSPIDSDSDDDTILDGIEVRHATFGFDPAVDSSARLAALIALVEEFPGVSTDAQNNSLSLGGISLTPSGGNSLSVDFIIEESEDLSSWTTVDTVSHSLDTSDTKKFIRVRKSE
jgi:hypothetical protein